MKKIRQMMAEQRYIEAQQFAEQTLRTDKSAELLGILIEIYLQQGISLPYELTLEFINQNSDYHYGLELIEKLGEQGVESRLVEIRLIEKMGDLDNLYNKISDFYLYLYERKIPRRFDEVINLRKKYFLTDFNLEMKEVALSTDRGFSIALEEDFKRLIKDSFQRANLKNRSVRLLQIEGLISNLNANNVLRIYGNLLNLYNHGIESKADYKKIIELILYFDELELKALVLNLIDSLGLSDAAVSYAQSIKSDQNYSFVHFEKYFPHLKKYLLILKAPVIQEVKVPEKIDLTLEATELDDGVTEWVDDSADSSDRELSEGLKHLDYGINGWLNLAVGFLQSDFNKSALICGKKVRDLATNDIDFLKGSYLAVHALIKLQDYRLALDFCFEALERSTLETDFLSFSYLEVELLIQLGEKASAKKVLANIQNIDNTYRLSAKMLKRLNEI